jgi:uncharacterized membrane protein YcaP (DUF421 family)
MPTWTYFFGATGHVAWWQEAARAALVFAYGLALVRLLGRRAFARWAALDIVVAIVAGSNLSRALTGNAPLLGTLVATTVLLILHRLCALVASRSRLASWLVEGEPLALARGGRIDRATARQHGVSEVDLEEVARGAGLGAPERADTIVLEPSGKIDVTKHP